MRGKLRWGILGTGNIARQFAQAMAGSQRGKLAAVGSRTLSTWGPEDTQGLLAKGHNWPLPTELVGLREKKGKNS